MAGGWGKRWEVPAPTSTQRAAGPAGCQTDCLTAGQGGEAGLPPPPAGDLENSTPGAGVGVRGGPLPRKGSEGTAGGWVRLELLLRAPVGAGVVVGEVDTRGNPPLGETAGALPPDGLQRPTGEGEAGVGGQGVPGQLH